MARGYYGIGIIDGKSTENIGTLWRSAFLMGAQFIFTVGARYPRQASDTTESWRHIPMVEYPDWKSFMAGRFKDCALIGVEMGGRNLADFVHPERAIYLLGAEDRGIPEWVQKDLDAIISIDTARPYSLNVAVAGSIVMYDRIAGAV